MSGEKRRAKSLRIGVHIANAVVWGPVYRTHLRSTSRADTLGRRDGVRTRGYVDPASPASPRSSAPSPRAPRCSPPAAAASRPRLVAPSRRRRTRAQPSTPSRVDRLPPRREPRASPPRRAARARTLRAAARSRVSPPSPSAGRPGSSRACARRDRAGPRRTPTEAAWVSEGRSIRANVGVELKGVRWSRKASRCVGIESEGWAERCAGK